MALAIRSLFEPDHERYHGVYRVNIYLLRLLFGLMLIFLGRDAWTHILTFKGSWDPEEAAAWCIWASYSVLSVLGLFRPLKMLPLVLLEVLYKSLWLILVAYPLWSADQLAGSAAEQMTFAFAFVVLPILAMPWKYVFDNYILSPRKIA